MNQSPLLELERLSVAYRVGGQLVPAVREVSLQVAAGEVVGLVGESGSGKTTIALAVLRWLGENGVITGGEIRFDGLPLHTFSPAQMGPLWGRRIGFVPQNPQSALNPSLRIGAQLREALLLQPGMTGKSAESLSLDWLSRVRVPDPARVARSYPHEISGGMQQRVLIALALSARPDLLILDEPTTSLDVTTQATILDLLRELIAAEGAAVLYVTHNLGVVAQMCRRVAVLYAGELVEQAPTATLFARSLHPYSAGLLAALPRPGQSAAAHGPLPVIPGHIPALKERHMPGCLFAPRCPLVQPRCESGRPILAAATPDHQSRCLRWEEIAAGLPAWPAPDPATITPAQPVAATRGTLQARQLTVHFPVRRSAAAWLRRQPRQVVRAVNRVNLTIPAGQTVGIVGESGSGKTTFARAVIGLTARTGGTLSLDTVALAPALARRSRADLRRIQYVFQNPEAALNPYLTIGETLQRPLITLLGLSHTEAAARVAALLAAVRLPAAYATRTPGQLSGGEKQRVAIARAFATEPDLLIADEAVSALDVSVQAAILNLLHTLQLETGSALLFISHDLAVVGYLADVTAVLYGGQVMSLAQSADLFAPPWHPYTEALLSANPPLQPGAPRRPIRLRGEPPDQMTAQAGCPFAPRCPRHAGPICDTQSPPWQQAPNGTHIFCHIPVAELAAQQTASASVPEGELPR